MSLRQRVRDDVSRVSATEVTEIPRHPTVRRGAVRVGKLPYLHGQGSKSYPTAHGFTSVNVCSSSTLWSKKLSPMILGPFAVVEVITAHGDTTIMPGGRMILPPMISSRPPVATGFTIVSPGVQSCMCQRFENYWQGSKVYDFDVIRGTIQESFFTRRAEMFANPKGKRRAVSRRGAKTVSAYYNGKLVPYLTARTKVYATVYSDLVKSLALEAWQRLLSMVEDGRNVYILDYDGRDVDITHESMCTAILDASVPFGHGFVLACMLMGLKPWEDEGVLREISERESRCSEMLQ